jgi:uncharacterized protein
MRMILALAAGLVIGRSAAAAEPAKSANELGDYLQTYREGAEAGIAQYQYNLGASYRWGIETEKNLPLAVEWIRKAAVQGYPLAERTLGEMYEKGEGLTASRDDAMHWYKLAAQHGDTIAQDDLAALETKIRPYTTSVSTGASTR